MFQIIQAADDLNLLTIEELRVAVGLSSTDGSQDQALEVLGLRVAARIAAACVVPSDGVKPPTLRLEGITETFRLNGAKASLSLSRRPVEGITSLSEDGTTLTQDVDFEVNAATGKLTRLVNDVESLWTCSKVVVEYDAGYDVVPDALKAVAAELAGTYWADRGADPMEKRLDIPGVISTERWVDRDADSQIPGDLMRSLIDGGFVNRLMVG